MKITIIYAECRGAIAIDGKLPVYLPEDLKFFKEFTMGKVLLMGRKTVESLPKKLEGRTIICLTREAGYEHECADYVVHTKKSALKLANELEANELVVAGGLQVYKMFLKEADSIVKTRANHTLIRKRDFDKSVKRANVIFSPDWSGKRMFDDAEVLIKTNKMIVVEYTWDKLETVS